MNKGQLPPIMKKELKALVKCGLYPNKVEISKEAFRTLLEVKPFLKIEAAIQLFKDKEISIGKAAEIAGVSVIEFKEILANKGIIREIGSATANEINKSRKIIKMLRK